MSERAMDFMPEGAFQAEEAEGGRLWPYQDEAPEEPEEGYGFVVKDDKAAEWCLRKIREAEADKVSWKEFYAEQYRKVEAECDRTIGRMKIYLYKYFEKVPHKPAKKSESYSLPGGKLVWKQQDPEFDYKSPAFVAWLKENHLHDFIKVKESPKWDEFKKTLLKDPDGNFETTKDENDVLRPVTADGEVVAGVEVMPRAAVFTVEVKKA